MEYDQFDPAATYFSEATLNNGHSNLLRILKQPLDLREKGGKSNLFLMAAPRILTGDSSRLMRDEEDVEEDDSPLDKGTKLKRFPLS